MAGSESSGTSVRAGAIDETHLTVVSWNIDGLSARIADLGRLVERFAVPAVICLQEVRIRPRDAGEVAALRSALAGYDCHVSLCRDPRNGTFRGGRTYGVATYVRTALCATERRFDWDLEGRAVASVFSDLAIVNVYGVNGTAKPYFDHALGRTDGDRHAFKRRFNQRLAEECLQLGKPLVMIGDWNISRTAADTWPRLRTEAPHALAREEFNQRFIPALELVDVYRELHPHARKYTWFNPRSRQLDAARVDYALISRSLWDRVVAADIEEHARDPSDHAPIWLTLRARPRPGDPPRPSS
jgi:exodeoxyribonuclease III